MKSWQFIVLVLVVILSISTVAEGIGIIFNGETIVYDFFDKIIGDLFINGNLNVTGNMTGNMYRGSMWYHNHTGTSLIFTQAELFFPLFFTNSTCDNGVTFQGGFLQESSLTVEFGACYLINFAASGDGQNNHEYFTQVFVNDIEAEECGAHHKMAAGGDIITQSGSCIVDLVAGDVITLRTADFTGTGTGNYFSANLNLVKIGN